MRRVVAHDHGEVVSTLTAPSEAVQSAARSRFSWIMFSFNAHRPFRGGAIASPVHGARGGYVSTLTAPSEAVQW